LEPLHGLAPGEFDGTFAGFLRAVHPADRDRLMDDIQAALAGGTGFSTEFRVIWPDGGVHWVAGIGRVARDADGRVDRMLGLGLDVTARRRGEERMRRLQEITAQLARSLDADELLAAIASAASDLLDVAVGAVFLLDADPAAGFVLAAGTGIDHAHHGALRLPRHGSLAGRALDAGRTLVVDDAAADPGTALPAVLTGQSSGSEIAAPILDERPVGVVKAFSPTLRRFDRDDVELLSALASAAGIALRNARLYREAGAAVAARDEFISVAAHELRTPVTALRGHAQLLERTKRRGELTDDRLDLSIRVLVESSKRLTGLVDDLLDVSRIQSGRLVLHAERMNLRDVVDRVVANRMVLGTTGHDIVVVGSAPCPVNADRDRIEQVLDNLVENAIKYSPAGGTIRIELAADGTAASLRVIDAGIGLPAGGAAAIFEPFGRAPNAVEQGLPGLGLGLYICRTIVEAHGGRIWAESAGEHRGTVVALDLPCASPVAGG
jgi:PAS domain S-box-containing protein